MNNHEQYNRLLNWFKRHDRIAVAFSGGVDSTFLLAAAQSVYKDNVLALTLKTPYIPEWEVAEATDFCKTGKIRQIIITSEIIPEIRNNPVNRCYLCKRHIFTLLKEEAGKHGYEQVIDGTNSEDPLSYRPGITALLELGIKSPLMELGLSKTDIRLLSANMGLPTADKPSHACLLTRFPYNYEIKYDELPRIEKAERYLASLGFLTSRVRNHGNIARIEIDKKKLAELVILEQNGNLSSYFHKLGFEFITVDLEGYRSGSFDKSINHQKS